MGLIMLNSLEVINMQVEPEQKKELVKRAEEAMAEARSRENVKKARTA